MSNTGEQLRPRNGNRPPNDGPDLTDPDLPWYIYRANIGMARTVSMLFKKVSLHEFLKRMILFGAQACPNGSRFKRLKGYFFLLIPLRMFALRASYKLSHCQPISFQTIRDAILR
jgi:hypothetical protein